ncbi:DgyrCDS7557 [Dimorphilus gyrociliatus]|uniref:DgyrCDS7557 n=1 Tax=Dimorphilus gyrociliatus TaxID=2664684 RepID=A0A7I8VTY0_9ANNE|nr:DgyrCDS7557 [Dimorphilus gyrociliatus]
MFAGKIIFLFFSLKVLIDGAKLNTPKVLLPYYASEASNTTLKVSGEGCFQWTSSRNDIATINPVFQTNGNDQKCAKSAVVTAVSRFPQRRTSVITAKDEVSGMVLTCNVIVDDIYSIDMETTTRELYLDDSPLQLIITAHDNEGNTFSSLEGVEFKWTLQPDEGFDMDPNKIIRFLPFSHSSYKSSSWSVRHLEETGRQGYTVLLEGIKTGTAKVNTKVVAPAFSKVQATTIRLVVIANVVLEPSLAFVLPKSILTFKVSVLKQGRAYDMNDDQFELETKEEDFLKLNYGTCCSFTALKVGESEVILHHVGVKIRDGFHEPSARIVIETAKYLSVVIMPDNIWVLEKHRTYTIVVHVYCQKDEKMIMPDNYEMRTNIPEEYFEVLQSSKNQSYFVVRALKSGHTLIKAQMDNIIDGHTPSTVSRTVEGEQSATIFEPLRVKPNEVFFPFFPDVPAAYSYNLKATGGSGSYTWKSNDTSVCTVQQDGKLESGNGETAVITATDERNRNHFATAVVRVVPPGGVQFRPHKVEAVIGESLELDIDLLTKDRQSFAVCTKAPFEFRIREKDIFVLDEGIYPSERGCGMIRVKALIQGYTEVTVELPTHGIKAAITIAAYEPLALTMPNDYIILSPGSSFPVNFENGPRPWILEPGSFDPKIIINNPEFLDARYEPTGFEKHTVRAVCLNFGENSFSLQIGNAKTKSNPLPVISSLNFTVFCSPVASMDLYPVINRPRDMSQCPLESLASKTRLPVFSSHAITFNLRIFDSQRRLFDNSSSLDIKWGVSDRKKANFLNEFPQNDTSKSLSIQDQLGDLTATAYIKEFKRSYLEHHSAKVSQILDRKVEQSVELIIVEQVKVEPKYAKLYNHPNNVLNINIKGGSKFFDVKASPQEIVDVHLIKGDQPQLELRPLKEGQTVVTVSDLCLASDLAQATITVSDVNNIIVDVPDKVQLHQHIKAIVRVLDVNNAEILASNFDQMRLRPKLGSNIISLKKSRDKLNPNAIEMEFLVTGEATGFTSLAFEAISPSGAELYSNPITIQVFPPVTIDPEVITMIVHSSFQVSISGGPKPRAEIISNINDENVAKTTTEGLITALKLGETRLSVNCYIKSNGKQVHLSSHTVQVFVVKITSLKLWTPLSSFYVGNEMPIYPIPFSKHTKTELNAMTFGTVGLKFTWNISDSKAVDLRHLMQQTGMNYQVTDVNNMAMRLRAHESGTVFVTLKITSSYPDQLDKDELIDRIEITVRDRFRMIIPPMIIDEILITPDTKATLRGKYENVKFSVVQQTSKLSINDDGTLISGSETGFCTLYVSDMDNNTLTQILVRVKKPSYIMLSNKNQMATKRPISVVPKGVNLNFTITVHDNNGDIFTFADMIVKTRTSRPDVGRVSKDDSLAIDFRALNTGHTLSEIWFESNKERISDYVSLNVGDVLIPSNAKIMIGQVLCFVSPFKKIREELWLAKSDQQSVTITREGIATGTSLGLATISYLVDGLVMQSNVEVMDINNVAFTGGSSDNLVIPIEKNFTNVVTLPVKLSSQHLSNSEVFDKNCDRAKLQLTYIEEKLPISCSASLEVLEEPYGTHLEARDFVHVEAGIDYATNSYVCRLRALSVRKADSSWAKLQAKIFVEASVENQLSCITPLSLRLPIYVNVERITIATDGTESLFFVVATSTVLDEVSIKVANEKLLTIKEQVKDSKNGELKVYVAVKCIHCLSRIVEEEFASDIHIDSPLTKESVTVKVFVKKSYEPREEHISNIFPSMSTTSLLIALILVLCIFIILALRSTNSVEDKMRQPSMSNQMNNSTNGSSLSPTRAPTPFLWSAAKLSSPPSPANAYSPMSPTRFSPPDNLRHRNYSLNTSNSR